MCRCQVPSQYRPCEVQIRILIFGLELCSIPDSPSGRNNVAKQNCDLDELDKHDGLSSGSSLVLWPLLAGYLCCDLCHATAATAIAIAATIVASAASTTVATTTAAAVLQCDK